MKPAVIPKFSSESEEAAWWDAHRSEVEAEIRQRMDLDDCLNGPRIQDLWMFLSGNADEQRRQWSEIMEGYSQFGALDHSELRLIEALRAARMLNHAAWIAERWLDPAFPRAFPWAGQARFWEGYVGDLMQQCEVLDEPPQLSGPLPELC